MSEAPEAFGFVPAHVVADLQDIGNWKSRATAIDVLHKCLNGVSSPATLVPALKDFVDFLASLIADPNFKIAMSSMSIFGDLSAKVGNELGPYLRVVAPAVLDKFSDSKVQVRSAAMKLARRLMIACTPGVVLALLAAGVSHSNWRVREEVINTTIMALLSFGPGLYDPAAAYHILSGGLSDGNDRVRLAALEGMAVLHSRVSSGELMAMMSRQRGGVGGGAALPEVLRAQVAARLNNPALPGINAEGLVEHVVELPVADINTDMRLADAALMGGGGRIPWTEASTPSRTRHGVGTGVPLGGRLGGTSLDQVGRVASEQLPGSRRDGPPLLDTGSSSRNSGHMSPIEDPGVISPAYRTVGGGQTFSATPSRFSSHEPAAGGATDVWGHGHVPHPPLGRPHAGDHPSGRISDLRDLAVGAVGSVGESPVGCSTDNMAEFRSSGSPGSFGHGHVAGGGPSSALQPLKHHWGASRSLESQSALVTGRSPRDSSEDSPLSPTRGYTVLVHNRHSCGPAGDGCQRDSLDLLTHPTSVRTQAAAELREARGLTLGSAPHPPQQSPLQPPPQSSSPMGWAQSSLEQEPALTRQETFSPSKAEMLARLKNRQIEKRAATAQQSDASLCSVTSDTTTLQSSAQSFSSTSGNPRRYLSQLSDPQRDRDRSEASRGTGYDSAASTPTRQQQMIGSASGGCFDEQPASAQSQRPPRGGLAPRLGRGAVTSTADLIGGVGGFIVQTGGRASPLSGGPASTSPCTSEESPICNPSSPALNRLRVRSADPNPAALGSPGGAAVLPATPIANSAAAGSSPPWDKNRGGDVATEELTPLADPDKHIRLVISRLVEANQADRKELNWQGQYEALLDARRLVRHHNEVVRSCLHEFVRAAIPAIDQLRSQTARCALALFQESFTLLGRGMDRELDDIVPVLLKKAGEVSNAGRDNFLSAEADRVLAEMYRCCGESRCLAALLICSSHKNPYVRGKVAYHLDNQLEAAAGSGSGRQVLTNNSTCLERVFRAAAGFLDEGSLDTRTHGKRIIWHIKALLASRGELDRLVAGITPQMLQRKVVDVVEGLNGPPPPPSRGMGAAAGGGSRLASRQPVSSGGVMMGGSLMSPVRSLLVQGAGSLTQPPPPPVRQGSYSAPSPMLHSSGVTPERRWLPRQRTNDLDGIPESTSNGSNSQNNSSNDRNGRLSSAASAAAAAVASNSGGGGGSAAGRQRHSASADGGAGSGFGPGVSEVVVKALQLLGAKDFRERMDALRSVEGVVGALPGAPDTLLMQVLDALVARLTDANAKVATSALEVVASLSAALRQRMALGLNTLVPALAAALGATNEKVRTVAAIATDALVGVIDPGMLVQHFSHCVANGTLQRGKPLLAEKLVGIVSALYGSKPQLVARYAVPAAFALLNDGRGGLEAKAAAGLLLAGLARLMGPALLEQASSLNAVAQQRVADAVAATAGQPANAPGGGGRSSAGGERDRGERDRTPRMMRTVA